MDEQRVDVRAVHRGVERLDLVVGVLARLPRARVLVEDLDGVAAAVDPALHRLGHPAGGRDVGTDEHARPYDAIRAHAGPLRSLPDGRAPHRRRAHGAVQLAPGPPRRRRAAAAHRGHRHASAHARERRADPRRAALARARLGRGAGLAGLARPTATRRSSHELLDARRWPTAPTPPATTSRRGRPSTAPTRASAASRRGRRARCRLRVPDEGETVVHDLIRGDTTFQHVHLDDPVIARADGQRPLQLRRRRRRPRRGDHARHPRRGPPLQHAQAAARLRGAGRRAAGLRAHPAHPRARRQEALQAPRRGVGAGAARHGLPARGGAQLPRAARLGRRGRRDDDVDRRARRSASTSRACRRTRRGSTSRSSRWLNGKYIRELSRRGAHRAAGGVHRAHRPRAGGGDLAREDPDARGLLAAGRASSSTGPADDPKAREKWLGDGGREALADARDGARGRRAVRPRARRGGAARASSRRARPSRRTSSSRSAWRSRARRSRPESSRRSRFWAATRRSRGSISALWQQRLSRGA